MIHPIVSTLGMAQALSLLALVAIFIRPAAAWSIRARLPVALIAFISSATLLFIHIL